MRHEAYYACFGIVNSVVVNKGWHSNDIHAHAGGKKEENTVLLLFIDGKHVVFRSDLNPAIIN